MTWKEVQRRLILAQEEYLMCIHKKQLTELDVYHRILRFKNYLVAMVNKELLPVKINVPFVGEKIILSHGLKYNLELLFFKVRMNISVTELSIRSLLPLFRDLGHRSINFT